MSDIIITSKNLSRFSKRLQKALETELGQEISLHQASLIFAKTLGVDTLHHLQKKLEESPALTNKNDINTYHDQIIAFIENYLKTNQNTKLLGMSVLNSFSEISINISAQNISNSDIEGFGIYFGHDGKYIDKEMSRLNLSQDDITFIKKLSDLMHLEDPSLSSFIGLRLSESLKMNAKQDSFYDFGLNSKSLKPQYESVANYGYCQKFVVAVENDFFERVSAPFVLDNDNYAFIDLSNETKLKFYNSVEEAIENKNELLIEFLTPINQFSNRVKKSIYKQQGICSFYIFNNENKRIVSSVNGDIKDEIKTVENFYTFLGKKYFKENKNLSSLLGLFPINHPHKESLEAGFKSFAQRKDIKKVVK